MVNKEQIIKGLTKYMEEEMIPVIEDKNLQIILALLLEMGKANPNLLDRVLKHKMVNLVFPYNNETETWDIDNGFKSLKGILSKYGSIKISVPPIPFVSPEGKELKFNANDITKLENFIVG